ncbi:C4-dicarboxylate ABC transporter substrate-binding protein [Skermanella aerolata]|uniref:C4-dicarboxylate ABC transporter substrate-binding protein n=1 Tax=Skermanella aerolata TaxID=393310 RepID=A0A512DMM5_9PROT|nr:TRAP transporter substrate-binding protein [Skermanella aerolata]KJB96619.1 C4-dicarboxylate ABC transporter [Skermanella aerolata KACC 11604]GEO37735.1 C4-dicarboxylate ABC transporter substrate-binding protein [Skermanella aerolata]
MSFNRKLLASVLFAGSLFASAASAQTEIKLGHVGEPGSLLALSAEEFARRVNEKVGGQAKIVVFGSSQLGGDSELLKKLKLGTVDLALPSTVMSSEVPLFGLFELPYLVKDRAHMARLRDEIVMPVMAPAAEKDGFKILGIWENGFRQITNSKRPIEKPTDLQGIKLRVPSGVWRVKMFQSYGANPSPMAFSEVFVALQTGVMDGQENPLAQIYPSRFYEVQKFLSMTNHVYTPAYLTAGRSWKKYSPEIQKALTDAAVETQPVVYEIAAKMDEDFLQKLKDGGMQVNQVDQSVFVTASEGIYKDFSAQVPEAKDLIQKAQELAKSGS